LKEGSESGGEARRREEEGLMKADKKTEVQRKKLLSK